MKLAKPLQVYPTTGQEPEALAKEVVVQSKNLVAHINHVMGK
jgi:hypothetical protein